MNRQLQTYGTQQVMTSDPVTLVALLYDKAVQSLRSAIEAIGRNEIEARWRANNKAMEILKHLLMTLDMEKGGEIASNLEAVYGYMLRRLIDVDIRNDARAAEEVIGLLEPLRSSWAELARTTREIPADDAVRQSFAEPAAGDRALDTRPSPVRSAKNSSPDNRIEDKAAAAKPGGGIYISA